MDTAAEIRSYIAQTHELYMQASSKAERKIYRAMLDTAFIELAELIGEFQYRVIRHANLSTTECATGSNVYAAFRFARANAGTIVEREDILSGEITFYDVNGAEIQL